VDVAACLDVKKHDGEFDWTVAFLLFQVGKYLQILKVLDLTQGGGQRASEFVSGQVSL
jgi:hypothetical protein